MNQAYKNISVKAASEIASIIVAVLFALWANDWWAQMQLAKEVDKITVEINKELEQNLLSLHKAHEYHSKQIDLIRDHLRDITAPTQDDYRALNSKLYRRGIFKPAELYFTSWEIAADKGLLSEISQDKLMQLKPAYNALERYKSSWRAIGESQVLVTLLAETPKEQLQVSRSSISQLYWFEKSAIDALVKATEK